MEVQQLMNKNSKTIPSVATMNIDDFVSAVLEKADAAAENLEDGELLHSALLSQLIDDMVVTCKSGADLQEKCREYIIDAQSKFEPDVEDSEVEKHIDAIKHHLTILQNRCGINPASLSDNLHKILDDLTHPKYRY